MSAMSADSLENPGSQGIIVCNFDGPTGPVRFVDQDGKPLWNISLNYLDHALHVLRHISREHKIPDVATKRIEDELAIRMAWSTLAAEKPSIREDCQHAYDHAMRRTMATGHA